jgi:soluble lytic murein transglycosylase-like protein
MCRLVSVLFSIALGSLALATPAWAGTVYRCVGDDGVPNYSSKRVANAHCTAIAKTASSRVSGFSPKTSALMPITQPLRDPTLAAAPSAGDAQAGAGATAAAKPTPVADFQAIAPPAPLPMPAAAARPSSGGRVLRGAVYRYTKDGVVHYTNVKPRGGAAGASRLLFSYVESCFACGVLPGVNFGSVKLNTSSFTSEIHNASRQFGVDEAVVRAIIHAESAYRANAVSHAGAQGLMQLIPATASRFGVADPFDPAQNIQGGVKYLAWLMKRYSSDLTLVAAAYNAGEGAVDRNGGVPPYSETRRYVQRVGQLADRYRSALAGP